MICRRKVKEANVGRKMGISVSYMHCDIILVLTSLYQVLSISCRMFSIDYLSFLPLPLFSSDSFFSPLLPPTPPSSSLSSYSCFSSLFFYFLLFLLPLFPPPLPPRFYSFFSLALLLLLRFAPPSSDLTLLHLSAASVVSAASTAGDRCLRPRHISPYHTCYLVLVT